jgi:hypothetical protein
MKRTGLSARPAARHKNLRAIFGLSPSKLKGQYMPEEFRSWAVVEIMGHQQYAGFVQAEVLAGGAMLRVDVPETKKLSGFTKYFSPNSIYGVSPCTEETARAYAESIQKTPFESWSVERQMMADLKAKGKLVEEKQLEVAKSPNGGYEPPPWENDDDEPF